MTTSLAKRLAELETMNTTALQTEWRRVFRSQPPSLSRDLLMRAIGHRYQEIEHGGLGKEAARKLRTLADGSKAASARCCKAVAGGPAPWYRPRGADARRAACSGVEWPNP